MIVLDLCRRFCPEKIPVKTTEQLGLGGADGEVFAIENEPGKVIKFSIIYDRFGHSPSSIYYENIVPVLDYVMLMQPIMFARIHEHKYLGEYSRDMPFWQNGAQTFVMHYCIMERLFSLTSDEKKVFHSIISHEDRKIEKHFSIKKIEKMLHGMSRGLDFNFKMIILFCEQLQQTKIKHNDLHPRNVMRTSDGHFKLTDFDRCDLI